MRRTFLQEACLSLFAAASLCVFAVVPSSATAPGDELRAVIEKAQQTLRDPKLRSDANKAERMDRLRDVIFSKFDFEEMAKRSLGADWRRRSPEERKEFVSLFTGLLESAYADSIASYDGENVVIADEKQDKDFAEVLTKIDTKSGENFSVNYKLHEVDGGWKIYDVVIENISLVNNYRSQFRRVIAKSSYENLLQNLKSKRFDAPGRKTRS